VPGRAYDVLFGIATGQFGYVTQDQALAEGLSADALGKMAKRGQVERVAHGLYRFVSFPHGPLDTYMEAALWPRGVVGVLSHETALDLYELSDANPAKIHLTVPDDHRVRRQVPKAYVLHTETLAADEVTWREGLPLTTVERTIRDCHADHLRVGLLEQAIEQARARGMLSAARARALRRDVAKSSRSRGGA
jgi:predicted transcriptional regulator of viral defense system